MKSSFLNLNTKFECFFMFEFLNDRIYFFALIKFVSTLIKFALYTSCLLYIRICLLHSENLFFALSKTVYCFLIKIVHYFLHKLFLAFCIKLFFVQHYLKNCSFSFLCKLFSVHYLKNWSLFSHKTPSEIVFLNLKAKSECFFMFKFHNNQICFSALIKSTFSHIVYLSRVLSSWMIVSVYLPTFKLCK